MLVSLAIIILISISGLALTYLFAEKESFMWRLCAGNIAGSAIFGLVTFLLALAFGLGVGTVVAGLLIVSALLLLLRRRSVRSEFQHDWAVAKGKLEGANFAKLLRFSFYAGFLILFWLFFERAMIVSPEGIFTGGSQNLGDLPFHLGAIFSFADGANFPPQNPSFAGARFTYPLIADFLTACLVKLGAGAREAMLVQNVTWAFSLLVILERFVVRLAGSRLAGKLAPPLLFFSGGFGFIWFFADYWNGTSGMWDLLWNIPKDYTIGETFRWGNSLVTLFITQRSLLLGMPLTLIVLGRLWGVFAGDGAVGEDLHGESSAIHSSRPKAREVLATVGLTPIFITGLLAGMLPLVHAHSLAVLFVVSGSLFLFSINRWKHWVTFGIGVCLIALPELFWALSGTATRTSDFIGWHFGFDSRGGNVVWFWFKNTGLFIPLLLSAIVLAALHLRGIGDGDPAHNGGSGKRQSDSGAYGLRDFLIGRDLLIFGIPFLFLFAVSNVLKLAPWEWDNIKVLIYSFVGAIPFVAGFVAWLWRQDRTRKAIASVCFAALIFSGAIDVWRTASGQIHNRVFDSGAIGIAEFIKKNTKPDALFLNAPTYNSAVVLSGRRSLMRYPGHLSSHGIEYAGRENDVKKMFAGDPEADVLMERYGIDYVLISPRERESLQVNEAYFRRFPVVGEEGLYRVYEVRER